MKLPEPNDGVFVLVEGRRLRSRVEELRGGDTVVIAEPSDDGARVPLTLGAELALEWTSERGLLRGEGMVADLSGHSLPLASVRIDASRVVQRRDHVRVDLVIDVEIRQASSVPQRGKTLDLSGGGMRAFFPLELVPGERVTATLHLTGEPAVEVVARVIRGSVATGYAFRLVHIDEAEQERLIKFVFAAHRREFTLMRRSA